jgi:ArsR family transcriptional regulator
METSVAIGAFGALAQETRLRLFRILIDAGPEGLSAGALAERTGAVPSSLSHHLSALEHAGLVSFVRRHRNLIYSVDPAMVRNLISFLVDDCCGGAPELCGLAAKP